MSEKKKWKGAGFAVSFFLFFKRAGKEGGNHTWREGKAGENDEGKESKFFPQMCFTSWSGKTSV